MAPLEKSIKDNPDMTPFSVYEIQNTLGFDCFIFMMGTSSLLRPIKAMCVTNTAQHCKQLSHSSLKRPLTNACKIKMDFILIADEQVN